MSGFEQELRVMHAKIIEAVDTADRNTGGESREAIAERVEIALGEMRRTWEEDAT